MKIKRLNENFEEVRKVSVNWDGINYYVITELDDRFRIKEDTYDEDHAYLLDKNKDRAVAELRYFYQGGDNDEIEITYYDPARDNEFVHSQDELVELIEDNFLNESYERKLKEEISKYTVHLYDSDRTHRNNLPRYIFDTDDTKEAYKRAIDSYDKGYCIKITNNISGFEDYIGEEDYFENPTEDIEKIFRRLERK